MNDIDVLVLPEGRIEETTSTDVYQRLFDHIFPKSAWKDPLTYEVYNLQREHNEIFAKGMKNAVCHRLAIGHWGAWTDTTGTTYAYIFNPNPLNDCVEIKITGYINRDSDD